MDFISCIPRNHTRQALLASTCEVLPLDHNWIIILVLSISLKTFDKGSENRVINAYPPYIQRGDKGVES